MKEVLMMDKKMILTAGPKDTSASVPIVWVSARRDEAGQPLETRLPVPSEKTWPLLTGFHAAGQHYLNRNQLKNKPTQTEGLFLDVYGREVLCLKERFPCFDSYDYLYEHRYYRWYFLRDGDTLTQIYYADEGKSITVTEDVAKVRDWMWERMQEVWNLQ